MQMDSLDTDDVEYSESLDSAADSPDNDTTPMSKWRLDAATLDSDSVKI